MSRSRMPVRATPESGFSLVEIIIAMLMLALMSMALLPLLWNVVLTSTHNRANVAATNYANTIVSSLRQEFPTDGTGNSCATLKMRASTPPAAPSGSNLSATVGPTPLACPSAYPGTVPVRVSVTSTELSAGSSVDLLTEFLVTGP